MIVELPKEWANDPTADLLAQPSFRYLLLMNEDMRTPDPSVRRTKNLVRVCPRCSRAEDKSRCPQPTVAGYLA